MPDASDRARLHLILPCALSIRGGRTHITIGNRPASRRDQTLIRALRSAHALLKRDSAELPLLEAAPGIPHRARLVRLAFLAPDLQQAILAGRQPVSLTLARLVDGSMPLHWWEQRRLFGGDIPAR